MTTAQHTHGRNNLIQFPDVFSVHDFIQGKLRLQQYAEELRDQWMAEQADLRRLHRLWEMKRPTINTYIAELYEEIQRLEQEIDDLLLEKIQSEG
ncbi:MAG: hypothetical protein IJ960_00185 [Oscillospiraceae bacterium]|nr:hypothetical protein [Oscillospiraceae bacterium]